MITLEEIFIGFYKLLRRKAGNESFYYSHILIVPSRGYCNLLPFQFFLAMLDTLYIANPMFCQLLPFCAPN